MSKRFIILISIMVAGFIGLIVYQQSTKQEVQGSQGSNNTFGKLDSPVTLTEYVDFQCEACRAFYPTVKEVKEKYKDKVKFEIKNFPIASSHANALAAAATAQAAAKQDKFFEMHDVLFERQTEWGSSQNRNEVFESYAEEIGLDIEQFKRDVASDETKAVIDADLEEVKKLGGNGTPTFALNGKKIDNPANTVESFSALLDEALRENSNS